MLNVFSRESYAAREPSAVTSRDRWAWQRADIASAYPTADYSLSYRFTSQVTPDLSHVIDAVESDGVFYVEIESSKSTLFTAGAWSWEAIISRTSDGKTAVVDRGFIEVTSATTASHTLKVLQAIRATIEGTASREQSRIEIGGRVLENRDIKDLTALEESYSRRWKREQEAINRAAGRPVSRTLIKMRA